MTKAQELARFDAFVKSLGPNSYLGPWLAEQRDVIEVAMISDDMSRPQTFAEAGRAADGIVEDAKKHAEQIIRDAKRRAEATTEEAREMAAACRKSAQRHLEALAEQVGRGY